MIVGPYDAKLYMWCKVIIDIFFINIHILWQEFSIDIHAKVQKDPIVSR
jgi:hypothetical protein